MKIFERILDSRLRDIVGVSRNQSGFVKNCSTTDAIHAVRSAAGTSPSFEVCVGVHQGSTLSPLLFILCIDTISGDLQSTTPWTLLYADDVMIAASTWEELQREVQAFKDGLEQ
ncbi:hypothetical protein Y032_0011g1328 [Ancylostoma ceylanicum]|uniref:Reverse transcriptase domain-containing protein n=1 Tax=Ancylostoma ceylanicum TaxID=53326 RepID=A0A016VE45_9BILA|nr:hypothetical protein Y032_0011g1328 [Ancylostoma ceylanicum]